GVMGLTKVTALETAGQGITCNAICPGWVRTALVERQIEALAQKNGSDIETAARELLAEKQPSLDFVTPDQLGQAAVFLCSDAAAQMTGAHLSMDGGWTARSRRHLMLLLLSPANKPDYDTPVRTPLQ